MPEAAAKAEAAPASSSPAVLESESESSPESESAPVAEADAALELLEVWLLERVTEVVTRVDDAVDVADSEDTAVVLAAGSPLYSAAEEKVLQDDEAGTTGWYGTVKSPSHGWT